MSVSTITSKGQTTIPADIRAFLHVGAGDQLMFIPQGGRRVLLVAQTRDVRELKGCLPKPKKKFTMKEIRYGIGKAIAQKHAIINKEYNKEPAK